MPETRIQQMKVYHFFQSNRKLLNAFSWINIYIEEWTHADIFNVYS